MGGRVFLLLPPVGQSVSSVPLVGGYFVSVFLNAIVSKHAVGFLASSGVNTPSLMHLSLTHGAHVINESGSALYSILMVVTYYYMVPVDSLDYADELHHS